MIRLHDVRRVYPSRPDPVVALDAVTLSVDPGEFVIVRGPSGGGKTTLLLTIGGLLHPSHGTVRIADTDPYTLSARARQAFRAERVGIVFQRGHLVPYLNVIDNLRLVARGADRADRIDRAIDSVRRLGLGARLTHRPGALSAGECQRVATVRAMVNAPDVLLADEPTGHLDPDTADIVRAELVRHHAAGGTVVLVTHDTVDPVSNARTFTLQSGILCAMTDPTASPTARESR